MKLKCNRAAFTTAFQSVAAVVPSRTPKPILTNVKLIIDGDQTVLIGHDGDIGIRASVDGVESDGEGEVLLPTARLLSILRELREESIEFDIQADNAAIKTAHSEFRFGIQDPDEFPNVLPFGEVQYLDVVASELKQMIRRTIFATDPDSTRYALGGILLEVEPKQLTLVSTDSRRLSLCQAMIKLHGGEPANTIPPVIPAKAMSLIERVIPDTDSRVFIATSANEATVQIGKTTIYSRLVEGRFPRYRDVVPKDTEVTVDLVCGPLYTAVRQSLIFTNDESRGVDFTFSKGMLVMNSSAADVGQSRVELPISYDGKKLVIRFDPRFVADFLKVLEPETPITLEMINTDSAAVFRTEDGYTYVVMPLERDR